jgi:hypothetical protein
MQRFFRECFSDLALGAVMAVALIVVLTMVGFILKEKLEKRKKRQRRERRRSEGKERVAAAGGIGRPGGDQAEGIKRS